MKTIIQYICETCTSKYNLQSSIFTCLECGTEICEHCMYGWRTCHTCAVFKTDEELKIRCYKFTDE